MATHQTAVFPTDRGWALGDIPLYTLTYKGIGVGLDPPTPTLKGVYLRERRHADRKNFFGFFPEISTM